MYYENYIFSSWFQSRENSTKYFVISLVSYSPTIPLVRASIPYFEHICLFVGDLCELLKCGFVCEREYEAL